MIIHHNGKTEFDMLVCMKLWIDSCYIYLLIQLFYVPWFRWYYLDTMTHDNNTRGKKDTGTFDDALKSIGDNLQKSISGLRDDILNIKDAIIQRLQKDNLKLKERVSCLEDKVIQSELKNSFLEQYGRRINLEIEGIPTRLWEKKLLLLSLTQ